MTDITCRLEIDVCSLFHSSALDVRMAPGEITYASETINCFECLLVSVMMW